ncbi:MAG: oligoendopeptidase F, partial [Parasporobacterium sp.]|nr:oligoendopeptidase F [Parasporobacterium sp.]
MDQRLPKRNEVAEELTWRLEDIYPDNEAWEKELAESQVLADEAVSYEGTLSESADQLYKALKAYDDCQLMLDRIGGYAHMRHDEDTANALYQELDLKAESSYVKIMEKL